MTTPRHRTNTQLRHQDAKNRSWRTILQGGAVVVAMGIVTGLLNWLKAGDFSLGTLGVAVLTAVLMSVAAWMHRTLIDPSRIPSAVPPVDPGPPATTEPAP